MESTCGVCLNCLFDPQDAPVKVEDAPDESIPNLLPTITRASDSPPKKGFAHSGLADAALFIGACVALLGCFVVVVWSVIATIAGNPIAPFLGILFFFHQFGIAIVFMRVLDMQR
jgi:hypothetical protein